MLSSFVTYEAWCSDWRWMSSFYSCTRGNSWVVLTWIIIVIVSTVIVLHCLEMAASLYCSMQNWKVEMKTGSCACHLNGFTSVDDWSKTTMWSFLSVSKLVSRVEFLTPSELSCIGVKDLNTKFWCPQFRWSLVAHVMGSVETPSHHRKNIDCVRWSSHEWKYFLQ